MRTKALALAAALLALSAGWFWLRAAGAPVTVAVPAGLSAAETAALLRSHGVIRFPLFLRAWAKVTGGDRRIKPGTYRLRRGMAFFQVLALLEAGGDEGVKVLIPEGFSARQIAERLEASGVCRANDFRRHVQAQRLEGYLFPTTYYFEPGEGAAKAAARMRLEFQRRVESAYVSAQPKPRLTLHQLVTLASIVEREAVLSREKPMIAAVYLNRMAKRMRLEADPTVQYALGNWKRGLTSADLRVPSAYNTYVHYGLPPGPICSPGVESFLAALRPAPTSALYFVADNSGGHVFSDTHDEHLKAKQSFKKGLRAIKARLLREEARRAGSNN